MNIYFRRMNFLQWMVLSVLVLSLSANICLLLLLKEKQALNVNQVVSRYYIETLLKSYDNDLSFGTVKSYLERIGPKVNEVDLNELYGMEHSDYDSKALAIGATRIYFKNNNYAGSQVVE